MTIPAYFGPLYRHLNELLALSPQQSGGMPSTMSKMVVPTVDMILAGSSRDGAQASRDLSGSAGSYVKYFTVPANTRWMLTSYVRENSAANTQVSLQLEIDTARIYAISAYNLASVASQAWILLEATDTIGMMATGNGSDSSRSLDITYWEYPWTR